MTQTVRRMSSPIRKRPVSFVLEHEFVGIHLQGYRHVVDQLSQLTTFNTRGRNIEHLAVLQLLSG